MKAKALSTLKFGARAVATVGVFAVISMWGENSTVALVAAPPPQVSESRTVFPAKQFPTLELEDGQQREVRSILNVRSAMRHGAFVWDDAGVPDGPVWIRVDLAAQTLSVFRAGHEIGTAVILYGASEKPTPRGRFSILFKRADHRSSLYDAPMPFTLRLTGDGVAIHGSDVANGAATHGCVGIPTPFAKRLFEQVETGDEVQIV